MRKNFKLIAAIVVLFMFCGNLLNTVTVFAEEMVGDISMRLGEEVFQKPLENGMVIKEKALDENGIVSRLEFMSMLNNSMGLFKEQTYKGLEEPNELWYSYVINTAKSAGYAYDFDVFVKNPEGAVTKSEAAKMIARIKKTNIYEIMRQGILDSVDDSQIIRKDMSKIFDTLKSDTNGNANVVRVDAISSTTILITFDAFIDKLDLADIGIYAAKGVWNSSYKSNISSELSAKKVYIGVNKIGNTVLAYELNEPLESGAIVKASEVEDYKMYFKDFEKLLTGDINNDRVIAENIVSWQMDHGGWTKNDQAKYAKAWDGVEKRSTTINSENGMELGTTDNNATIREIIFLADIYNKTKEQKFKDSLLKGVDFLLKMQYPSGGWPQMYPSRTDNKNSSVYYSNYVTFNDDAMGRVLKCLDMIINQEAPFNSDIVDKDLTAKLQEAYDKGIDYVLKSQVRVNGKLTVWCAQHDPVTYEPRSARAYEHESLSGSESIGLVNLLMSTPKQTPEVREAIKGALEWFDAVKVEGVKYDRKDPRYFFEDPNSTIWYRFYEIGTNRPIFSSRDGIIKYEHMEIEQERRDGYSWATSKPGELLNMAKTSGYYKNKVYVKVKNTNSKSKAGFSLKADKLTVVNDMMNGKLVTIPDIVWTDDIKNINKSLEELVSTGSGKIYDNIQATINSLKLSARDRGYLLGELASWGKRAVFTEEYKTAVDSVVNAGTKLDADSVFKAETAISKVTNNYSKEYLLEELAKIKTKIK
jgi:PelA/Pel-15E family pectate lyase